MDSGLPMATLRESHPLGPKPLPLHSLPFPSERETWPPGPQETESKRSALCLRQAVDEDENFTLPGTIKEIMDRWTLQMGFPVLTVDTRSGSVAQKHFLLDPNSTVLRPSEFKWVGCPGPRDVLCTGCREGPVPDKPWCPGGRSVGFLLARARAWRCRALSRRTAAPWARGQPPSFSFFLPYSQLHLDCPCLLADLR